MRILSRSFISFVIIVILSVFSVSGILNSVLFAQDETPSNGGIGGRPAFPRDDNARSESIFIHTLSPGESAEDGINIVNNADETRSIAVYATDSLPSSGGAFACKQQVEQREDVGSWVNLKRAEVTLESTESTVIPFTVTVPEGTGVGEHDGCIVVQEILPPNQVEQGIGLSFRTAIRLAVLVPGDIVKDIFISDYSGSVVGDEVVTTVKIQNNGNVSVDTNIKTDIKYFGLISISENGGRFPALRGLEGEWNFNHPRPFWGGLIRANVDATYDPSTENFLGDQSNETAQLTYPGFWIWVWPQPVAAIIEIGLVLLVVELIYIFFRRKRHQAQFKKSWKNHTVARGQDIKSIAKTYSISWKDLARANKIKAPYTLKTGQKIKVPPKKKDKNLIEDVKT